MPPEYSKHCRNGMILLFGSIARCRDSADSLFAMTGKLIDVMNYDDRSFRQTLLCGPCML
jgi:hypothetical protein